MKIIDLLIGKKLKLTTDLKTEVILEVEKIEYNNDFIYYDLASATKENDWWPPQERRGKEWYDITFTNGAVKRFDNLDNLNIVE